MKRRYIKKFENFEQPEGTGTGTFWETEVDGETVGFSARRIC
jgi:hypothetical protein